MRLPLLVAGCLSASVLAVASTAAAYRTAADAAGMSGTERIRWRTADLRFVIGGHKPADLEGDEVEHAVREAFATWAAPDCTGLTPRYMGETSLDAMIGDGRASVQWLRTEWDDLGLPADVPATTDVAYRQDEDGDWEIVDADILLNRDDFEWSVHSDGEGQDLPAILTHEIGHVLGLLHVCEPGGRDGAPECEGRPELREHVMHPNYQGLSHRELSEDDAAGVCFLYPPPSCEESGCPSGLECTELGCRFVCDGTVCRAGERCGSDGCTAMTCEGDECDPTCDDLMCGNVGENGDPCASDAECDTGLCGSAGYCVFPCHGSGHCPDGYRCHEGDPSECRPEAGIFGQSCDVGSDCASMLCLEADDAAPMCTRACGSGFADCPVAYECAEVDGSDVCAPAVSGGGCSVSRAGRPVVPSSMLGLLALAAFRRRRKS